MTKACTILSRWTLSSSLHVVIYFFLATLGKYCCVHLTGRETEAQKSWALSKDIDLALCDNLMKARTSGFSACHPFPVQPPLELCTVLTCCLLGGFPAVKGVINPNCFPDCQLLIAPANCLFSPSLSSALLSVKHMNFLSSFPWGKSSCPFPSLLQRGCWVRGY